MYALIVQKDEEYQQLTVTEKEVAVVLTITHKKIRHKSGRHT